jgi:hypothetical protein
MAAGGSKRTPLDDLAGRVGGIGEGLHQRREDVVVHSAPVAPIRQIGFEIGAIADYDQLQRGDGEQHLMTGACTGKGVRRQGGPRAARVGVPAKPRGGGVGVGADGQTLVADGHRTALHHPRACFGGGARRKGPAAPVAVKRETIDFVCTAIADRPFGFGDPEGVKDPGLEQRADVGLRRPAQTGRHRVGEGRHAGVAVGPPGTRFEQDRRFVHGGRERVRLTPPEPPFPARDFHVRDVVLLSIFDPGRVGGQVADQNPGFQRIVAPGGDVLRGGVGGLDPPILNGEHQGDAADESLGE